MWRLPYLLIVVYRRALSPLLPHSCRFSPSCSAYAAEALRTPGTLRGGLLAARRLMRCHPWHPGGHDPVPPPAVTLALPHSPTGERSHG
ncbi:MAG: membrane protein insertion efficiency factor YidD [Candidatus Krumholzibacteriia bacterium]